MTSAARGDVGGFEEIVLRHQAAVWRMAHRFVGNSADAQDITQIVFLKLFESAPQYRATALFKTYLFRIVHTTCIDHSRKKRPVAVADPCEIPDDAPSAIDAMIMHETKNGMQQCIETLPPRQRSAITLRYEAELSIREIADILKTTEKSVERLLAHGRGTLLSIVKEK